MKEKRPGRIWFTFLACLIGCLEVPIVLCQSYDDGRRGDSGENPVAALGFSGVVSRHDGYVKGEAPTIPQTSFSCSNQPHNPGLYADMETQCQVYHVCFEDRQESFLCGPGTNFNQRILACDFWYNFNCQESASFYGANADIGKVPETVHRPNVDHQRQTPRPVEQPRQPQPQRPVYPNFPEHETRPVPQGGSYPPPRVSVPPPQTRPQPHPQPQRPEPPHFQPEPQPPRQKPQPPRTQPPTFQPRPPTFQPEPPSFQPEQPNYQPRPQPPSFQPQPQPPRIHPQPPAFKPDLPQSQYPRIPQGSGQPAEVRPPPPRPPSFQQEEDSGFHFDGYKPQQPKIPPQQPVYPLTPRPVFPPVISPPRVSRPPLTPPVIRQPSGSSNRPRVPVSRPRVPQYPDHPDANIKGQTDYRPPQQPREPQPSRPVGIGYPSYPVPRPPTQKPPTRPFIPPPQPPIQQEHIDTEYIPPPPPPPPKEPSKPIFVRPPPPPPPPVQHEERDSGYIPRPPPSRPSYDPPSPQEQIEVDYRPQPPVAPSIIREQQKPGIRPPTRPQTSVSSSRPAQPQPPQRPRPVFPPASDHPNANIKGGPGYQQPPPPPRFEPTRISRPSTSQAGYLTPPQPPKPVTSGGYQPVIAIKTEHVRQPSHSGATGIKLPERVKKPSEPTQSIYQPPISPVIDHPRSEIKGSDYQPPIIHQQPQRIQSPSTSTGVKRPQRPRAPVVVSRPSQPKKPIEPIYERPEPQAPATAIGRVKLPSQTQTVVSGQPPRRQQPRFPVEIDHPNANIKGNAIFHRRPQPQAVRAAHIDRPSAPSISFEQKTSVPHQGQHSGSGYPSQQPYPPKGDDDYYQQEIEYQQAFKPQRRPQPNAIHQVTADVKDSYHRPQSPTQHIVRIKPAEPNYEAGSSYTRGPETYPKPEFGQSSIPYKPPVSTPSRSSHISKERQQSQNSILPQTKPVYQGSPATSGSGTQVRPDYPFGNVPGFQPPHQRQVFPHRENPDHPNESLKGSAAYRPPPPAGFQSSASEIQEQEVAPGSEPEPSSALLGDIGAE